MDQVAQEGRSTERPRTRAAFDPPPEKFGQSGVIDPFSFPPGLIPSLLSEKQKLSFSYCPINSEDIQKSSALLIDATRVFEVRGGVSLSDCGGSK